MTLWPDPPSVTVGEEICIVILPTHLESLSEERLGGGDVLVDGVLRLVLLGDGERAEPRVQRVAAHSQLQERALLGLLVRRKRDLKRASLRQKKKE